MGRNKLWSAEEIEYLERKWGDVSIPAIAAYLGRSVMAIKLKATRLGLGAVLENGNYLTFNQLLIAVTGTRNSYSYKMISWVKNRGLPLHTRKVNDCSFRVVYIDEFWKWAEKNRSFIDFSKMEPLILGKEPEWVAEQRKKDFMANAQYRKDPWAPAEDEKLKFLLKQYKYGYTEIAEMLCRSEGAIKRRCCDLGIKERPVRADSNGKTTAWTDEMVEAVIKGIKSGECYAAMGKKIGRSAQAVQGKIYSIYKMTDVDKVRRLI